MVLCSGWQVVSAQEIYNFVLENATRVANSPTSSFTQSRVAQFKRTTLTYIKLQALDNMTELSGQFLDNQAFFLSEFLDAYFQTAYTSKKKSPERLKEIVEIFQNASFHNPLFDDDNVNETQAYVTEPNHITPFSTNTDWQKAYNEVRETLGLKR
ncbi:MAG: hypothetical protein IJ553_01500 [Alloprevotella sp.]|nr:hypothetical protein [Alloprevotella sp.]